MPFALTGLHTSSILILHLITFQMQLHNLCGHVARCLHFNGPEKSDVLHLFVSV